MAGIIPARNMAVMRLLLKEARKRAGLTQETIAEKLDVSASQVSRWENGKDGIPHHRLPSIAEAYGTTIGQLFGETPVGEPVTLSEQDARLVVLYVARRFGAATSPDDPEVGKQAQVLQAFAKLAADPRAKETGFLDGFLEAAARLPA